MRTEGKTYMENTNLGIEISNEVIKTEQPHKIARYDSVPQKEKKKMPNLQNKSHEALLKVLNNVGIVGSVLAGIADIIFVIIFLKGTPFLPLTKFPFI